MPIVFLNGEFTPLENAKVSVLDRGFLFGDGVYEVIPVYQGRAYGLQAHLSRLQRSLSSIGIDNLYSDKQWQDIVDQLVVENSGEDQGIYLQVTRGAPAIRDHVMPADEEVTPTVFAMSRPITQTLKTVDQLQMMTAISCEDIRWNRCDIKSISLLGNVLLKEQAAAAGAKEAILLRDGFATEGAASNLFAVIDDVICTAPCDHRILGGVTRDIIVSLLERSDIPFCERHINEEELLNASEIWMTSSTKEIMPVNTLNGEVIGNGEIGARCKQTAAIYLTDKNNFIQQGESKEAKGK